jgi:hypothetical protein
VWNNPVVWPQWQPLLPHVLAAVDPVRALDEVVDDTAWLLDRAATYLLTRGEPGVALPLLQRSHASSTERLGGEHPATLVRANVLALGLREIGEHQQASDLYERTLSSYQRIMGEDHPDTLTVVNNFGRALRALGRHGEARELHESALVRLRRTLGDDNPLTSPWPTILRSTHASSMSTRWPARWPRTRSTAGAGYSVRTTP